MSVIIRLQGLPWSANALDVRHFFQGLAIPEGGVHIVGGEQGDVFIAFSTDEDARRAMLMDGGRIIDSRVKLLLSSRSEMQKVIENARSKNLVMQGMMTQPVPMGVSSPSTPGGPMGGGVTGAAPGMASTTPNSATASVPHKEMQAMGMNASGAAVTTPGVQMAYVNRMMHPSMGVGQQQQMSPQYQPMQHQGMMDFQGPNKNSSMLGTGDMSGPAAGTVMHDQGMVGGLGDVSKKGGDRDRRDRDVGDRSRERDRDRDRDRERGRRRERSRSPRRRSRERDRERFRERDRDRRRSTSRGRTGDAMPDRGPREEPGAAFGDGPQGSLGELFAHDVDSRRGGDGGGMMSQFRMNEPSGNTVATTRPSFQAGRGGLMTPGDTGGAAGMPRMSSGSGRPLGASRWDTDDDRSSMQDKSQAVDRNPSRNFGGGSGGSPHQQDERPWDRDRRIGNADDTNFRSGPMQPQNDGMAFRGVCVAIQGAPFNVNPIQIRDFFAGLSIPIDGIRLPVDERGRRLLLAFVRFGNERDRDLALKRPGKQYLGNSPVDVVPCSDDDFLNASDASNSNNNNNNNNNNSNINNNSSSNSNFGNQGPMRPLLEPPSRPDKDFGEFCVLLKGLPFSCREGDVVRFFSEFNIRDVIVEYDQSGRASGAGFVEFANPMEAKRSLGLNGEKIGHRYIDISLTSKEHMESARCGLHGRGGVNRDNSNYGAPGPERGGSGPDGPFGGRFNDGPPRSSPMFRGGGDNNNFDRDDLVTDCAKVTGLPFHATDRDILNFFSAVEIVPIAIHMMLNSNGQPSGDAFCEFANPHDCKMALRQNGVPLYPGSRYFLSVKATPRREVEHTLGANASGPNQQGGHMRGDDMKPGLLGSPPGPVMGDNHPQFRPQQDSPHMQPPHFRQGNRHQGPQRPPGPDHHQGNPHRGGDMPVSPPPQNHPMNRPNRATVDTFGRPGCVVGAANVPYRSSVEDILDFFQGFGLTKDCVIRRFNEKGLPTGDARIAFHCPEDAQAAIRQLNKTPMYGRIITLHLV